MVTLVMPLELRVENYAQILMGCPIHYKVSNCYIIMKVFDRQVAVHFVGTKADCETEQDK